MRVLIVEDEPLIVLHLEMLVTEFGHEVCAVASSASEASARAASHHPDVVLVDIRLAHGSSGVDAARAIYAQHKLRCIFLSGNLDEATQHAVRACEPIAFLGKPILPVQLQWALQKAENARAQMSDLAGLNIE